MAGLEEGEARRAEVALIVGRNKIATLALQPLLGATLPFRLDLLLRIEELLDELAPLAADGRVRTLLVRTVSPRADLPGYDLDELRLLHGEQIAAWALEAQRVLRRIEQLDIPTIAVIREGWLGGAAELALACSHRIAADLPEATIGFPQTAIGFIPAWGGTVRLPRLIGIRAALELVVTASVLHADQAKEVGLLDEVFASDRFEARLVVFARKTAADYKGRKRRRLPIHRRILTSTFPGRRWTARKQRKLLEEGGGRAAATAFRLITENVGEPLDQAFAREAMAAGELIVGEDARGRLQSEKLSERAARRSPAGIAHLEGVAILGTGPTAVDLANHFLAAGAGVIAKGVDRPSVRSMEAQIRAGLAWEVERERITDRELIQRGERFRGTTGYGGMGTAELLVAVPEGSAAGVEPLVEVEAHLSDGCLMLASGMSSSLSRIQRTFRRPERLVGIQIWSPIEHFPLLEIVPGTLSSPDAIHAVRRLARRLDLTAINVGEGGRTPSARLLGVYFREALALGAMGLPIDRIDTVCEGEGMLLGPFRRIDVLGAATARALLDGVDATTGILDTAARTSARFYRYRDGQVHRVNPDFEVDESSEMTDEAIWARIFLALVNEAAAVLAAELVADPRDLDLISIHGLGFPRSRGGLLFHAEESGLADVVVQLEGLAASVDARFRPAGLLRDLALIEGSFFGSTTRSSGHPG